MRQANPNRKSLSRNTMRAVWITVVMYFALTILQPGGLDPGKALNFIAQSPDLLIQQIITGLADGAIIAIIALGYTMVYGITELVNFAHGDVFMLGTFVALLTFSFFSTTIEGEKITPLWGALIAFIPSMAIAGGINAAIERYAYRRLRHSPRLALLISAIGMSFVLQNIGLQLGAFGKLQSFVPFLSVLGNINANPKTFPRVLSNDNLLASVFGADFPIRIHAADVLVIVIAVALVVALTWFVQNTRMGKAMRATAQNSDAAQIMGIDINQTIGFTFLLGGALAGAAAVMHGIYNGSTVFTVGFQAGLRSFTAAVLGGIGNIRGAALGGLLIGLLTALSDTYLSTRWTNAWVFLILVLVLLIRPTGLIGSEVGEKA